MRSFKSVVALSVSRQIDFFVRPHRMSNPDVHSNKERALYDSRFFVCLKKSAQSRFLSVTESRKIDTEQRE